MTPEEMKAALVQMNDDAWNKRDLDAAYAIYADDVIFQRVPFAACGGQRGQRGVCKGWGGK